MSILARPAGCSIASIYHPIFIATCGLFWGHLVKKTTHLSFGTVLNGDSEVEIEVKQLWSHSSDHRKLEI